MSRQPRPPPQPVARGTSIDCGRTTANSCRNDWSDCNKHARISERYAPRDPFRTLVAIVIFLMTGTLFKGIARVASVVLVSRAAGRTTTDLRCQLFRALLSDKQQNAQRSGDAAARVGADVASIGGAIQTLFGSTIQEPLKMAACLVGAAAVNWRLMLFSLLACPLASLLLLALARSIRRASLRILSTSALMMGRMLQTSQGVHIVKAYNMESHERLRFWQHALHAYREQLKINIYGGLVRVNNELLGIAMVCLSALAGGYLVLNQQTHLWGSGWRCGRWTSARSCCFTAS